MKKPHIGVCRTVWVDGFMPVNAGTWYCAGRHGKVYMSATGNTPKAAYDGYMARARLYDSLANVEPR